MHKIRTEGNNSLQPLSLSLSLSSSPFLLVSPHSRYSEIFLNRYRLTIRETQKWKVTNERKKARVKTTTNTIESYFEQIKPNELKRDENYNRIKALLENHTSKDREKRDKKRLSSQDNTCAKSFQWKEMKYLLHMNEVEYKLQSFFFFHHLHSLLLLFLCSNHTSHWNYQ